MIRLLTLLRSPTHFASEAFAVITAALSAALLAGCSPSKDAEQARADSFSCSTEQRAPLWLRTRNTEPQPDDPSQLSLAQTTVLSLERIDLDCDGIEDLVAQTSELDGLGRSRLWITGFLRDSASWRLVLRDPSVVDGYEGVALAADLNSDGMSDVLFLGQDEGGVVPHLMRSTRERMYERVRIPSGYRLRNETEWGASCWSRLAPALADGRQLRLARETISPESTVGHGTDCDLPLDTLALQGDSLVRLEGNAAVRP